MRDSSEELNFQYFTFQWEERNRKSSFYGRVPVFSLLWWDTREHQLKEGGFVDSSFLSIVHYHRESRRMWVCCIWSHSSGLKKQRLTNYLVNLLMLLPISFFCLVHFGITITGMLAPMSRAGIVSWVSLDSVILYADHHTCEGKLKTCLQHYPQKELTSFALIFSSEEAWKEKKNSFVLNIIWCHEKWCHGYLQFVKIFLWDQKMS